MRRLVPIRVDVGVRGGHVDVGVYRKGLVMTKQREFKTLVRERMAKTGERYTAARAQLLAKHDSRPSAPALPGLLDGYDRFGGIQAGTAAIQNVLKHSKIVSPQSGTPYSETTINGLCGGPGFLYAVFQYKGWPPLLTITLQQRSMQDEYVEQGLSRLGVRLDRSETSSASAARKKLDEVLTMGRAAICVVDLASLPWYDLPQEYVGGAPHVIAVVGRDGDAVWVDDRSPEPTRLKDDDLANARARYRKARSRLISIVGPDPKYDARKAMRDAIGDTARSYVQPPVPKSFWVNCGFSGLGKWQKMLTDQKDDKGWPQLFREGALAYAGLHRVYECIECQSAPGGGRPLYADFLDEAAQLLNQPPLKKAAELYREAGQLWARIAGLIANCPDKAVREGCETADLRLQLDDDHGGNEPGASGDLKKKGRKLAEQCRLTKEAALALYAEMADLVGQISEAERAAVEILRRANA